MEGTWIVKHLSPLRHLRRRLSLLAFRQSGRLRLMVLANQDMNGFPQRIFERPHYKPLAKAKSE
jgi:hypothetical protein